MGFLYFVLGLLTGAGICWLYLMQIKPRLDKLTE